MSSTGSTGSTTSLQTRAERRGGRGLATAQLIFSVLAVIGMGVIMWAALVYARPAVNLQGDEQLAQRIFPHHLAFGRADLGIFERRQLPTRALLVHPGQQPHPILLLERTRQLIERRPIGEWRRL